ncbi:MAG TPA: tRNA (guanosine(46)-N7)-methyltransferase TrmB [Gammaproteobacteria bacterium]|nr:tRNA (guanosine(46)-N7)-methyltransferase TrmB [Gammaproteobacteria bacterium]HIK76719.1 tRNA (guanosine(46)-N7)-methyltransferase TrmB [Gammaproteobacteria bacterium]
MQNSRKHNKKSIRSFVKRSGRLTKSQKNALQDYSSNYILDTNNSSTDLKSCFDSKQHGVVIEIGFGDGVVLIESAIKNPDKNFIGIEVYDSGLGQCLNEIDKHKIENIRLIYGDAVEVFEQFITKQSVEKINILFPDPWPKKRHHKRRLINKRFLALLSKSLINKGIVNVSTDWEDYAQQIELTFKESNQFKEIKSELRDFKTKFEKRGIKLGHKIFNYSYQLT